MSSIEITPVTAVIGAEVHGIDLREELSDVDVKIIRQALLDHLVVFFRDQHVTDELKSSIDKALQSQTITVNRRIKSSDRTREIDIRKFIKAIDLHQNSITIECNITPAGTVRPDEILNLLNLDYDKLSAPISRKNVKWITKN